jgi:hypothetical protein
MHRPVLGRSTSAQHWTIALNCCKAEYVAKLPCDWCCVLEQKRLGHAQVGRVCSVTRVVMTTPKPIGVPMCRLWAAAQ